MVAGWLGAGYGNFIRSSDLALSVEDEEVVVESFEVLSRK